MALQRLQQRRQGSDNRNIGRGRDDNWKEQQEAAKAGLAELCKLAVEVEGGWDSIIGNLDDDDVAKHVKAIRDADHNADPVVMGWALRKGMPEEGMILLGKDEDRRMRNKVAGFMTIFELAGIKATFTKREAAVAYRGLNGKQQEQVRDAVREAAGYKPNTETATVGGDDDISILNEVYGDLQKGAQDPGVDFVEWLLDEKKPEPGEEKPEMPATLAKPTGLRKLGDVKVTSPAPAKRVLGKNKPASSDNGNDPKAKLITLLEGVKGLKSSTAKNIITSIKGDKPLEEARRTAVNLKVLSEDDLKKAGL